MSTTNKLELVQMLRLRPDKNITRSKMYIRSPNGGYMKRLDPKTGEEENYTLKRLLLDIKYKAIHKPEGAERYLNEYLIRIVFNHEIVLKSALKSVRDPGHEEAIEGIHGYLSKDHASSLHNSSRLPLHGKIMSDFDVILKLKNKYHKTTYLDKDDTYIQEDKLIRENDIQLDDINDVGIEYDSIFGINSAIDFYSRMKKIYVDLQDVLLRYKGNDIIFNKYTVAGRDDGKGKMNAFEEESKKLIETIQTMESDYVYFLSEFESRAKEIMIQIHIRLKSKDAEIRRRKQFLHGVMLSLGENIKILDHYIKIFFNEINLLSQSVRDAIRKQNQSTRTSPTAYGSIGDRRKISPTTVPSMKNKGYDSFYEGMTNTTFSPTTSDGKAKPFVDTTVDKDTQAEIMLGPGKTRKKKKKKKKKKKNTTQKNPRSDTSADEAIALAMEQAQRERLESLFGRKDIFDENGKLKAEFHGMKMKDIIKSSEEKYTKKKTEKEKPAKKEKKNQFLNGMEKIRQDLEKEYNKMKKNERGEFLEILLVKINNRDGDEMFIDLVILTNDTDFKERFPYLTDSGEGVYKFYCVKNDYENYPPEFHAKSKLSGLLWHPKEGVVYNGLFTGGMYHGRGTLDIQKNGIDKIFTGHFHRGSMFSGTYFNMKNDDDPEMYTGNMVFDDPNGFGKMNYNDTTEKITGVVGSVGEWLMNEKNGYNQVRFTHPTLKTMMVYEGNFRDDKRLGYGFEFIKSSGKIFRKGLFLEYRSKLVSSAIIFFIPQTHYNLFKKLYLETRKKMNNNSYHNEYIDYKNNDVVPQRLMKLWIHFLELYLPEYVFVGDNSIYRTRDGRGWKLREGGEELKDKIIEDIVGFLEESYISYLFHNVWDQRIKEIDRDWNDWKQDRLGWYGNKSSREEIRENIGIDTLVPGGIMNDSEKLSKFFSPCSEAADFFTSYYEHRPKMAVFLEEKYGRPCALEGYIRNLPKPSTILSVKLYINNSEDSSLEQINRWYETRLKIASIDNDEDMEKASKEMEEKTKRVESAQKLWNMLKELNVRIKTLYEDRMSALNMFKKIKENKIRKKLLIKLKPEMNKLLADIKREMATPLVKTEEEMKNSKTQYMLILRQFKNFADRVDEIMKDEPKKKGGRRTRKKRGSSREEVCSQLLERLKMINRQIEWGGFDIDELKKDGKDTLEILKKCVKDGLIDITEYMKIKMEYENYFKQY